MRTEAPQQCFILNVMGDLGDKKTPSSNLPSAFTAGNKISYRKLSGEGTGWFMREDVCRACGKVMISTTETYANRQTTSRTAKIIGIDDCSGGATYRDAAEVLEKLSF